MVEKPGCFSALSDDNRKHVASEVAQLVDRKAVPHMEVIAKRGGTCACTTDTCIAGYKPPKKVPQKIPPAIPPPPPTQQITTTTYTTPVVKEITVGNTYAQVVNSVGAHMQRLTLIYR